MTALKSNRTVWSFIAGAKRNRTGNQSRRRRHGLLYASGIAAPYTVKKTAGWLTERGKAIHLLTPATGQHSIRLRDVEFLTAARTPRKIAELRD